jgi:hypothetical protein
MSRIRDCHGKGLPAKERQLNDLGVCLIYWIEPDIIIVSVLSRQRSKVICCPRCQSIAIAVAVKESCLSSNLAGKIMLMRPLPCKSYASLA